MSLFADIAKRVYRGSPWLKRLIPRKIKRIILLNVIGVGRDYIPPPSRVWLERQVLPILPDLGFSKILFVGAAPYTWQYEKIIMAAGGDWTTVDANPSTSVWGAQKHVEAKIQEIGNHIRTSTFDCVILNGVFGFGVNTPGDMNQSLKAIKTVMRSGGLLLLGWNTDVITNPIELEQLREGFRLAGGLVVKDDHQEFPGESHVYDFFVSNKHS